MAGAERSQSHGVRAYLRQLNAPAFGGQGVSCQIRLGYAAAGLSYAATNPVTSSKCGEFAGLSRFGKIRGVGAGSTPRQPPL